MVYRLAMLLCVAVVAGGCASIKGPTASISRVAVTQQTDQGARIETTITLHNPNDVVLPLVKAHYRVEVAGLKPFAFDAIPDKALPAVGDQTLVLPAAFATPAGQIIGDRVYRITGYVTVQPPGSLWQVYRQSGLPLPRATFSQTGRVRPRGGVSTTKKNSATDEE